MRSTNDNPPKLDMNSLEPVMEYGISLIQPDIASLAALPGLNKLGLRMAKIRKRLKDKEIR